MKYATLDQILYGIEKNIDAQRIIDEVGVSLKDIKYVEELVKWSKHMRELPPSMAIRDGMV